jgi:hypothetical protein
LQFALVRSVAVAMKDSLCDVADPTDVFARDAVLRHATKHRQFRFNGPTPEALVKGGEKSTAHISRMILRRTRRGRCRSRTGRLMWRRIWRPGRMRAEWSYFAAWPQTAQGLAERSKTRLTMPVLAISREKASAAIFSRQMKLLANDVANVELKMPGIG